MRVTFPGFVDLQVNGFAGVDFNTPGLSCEQVLGALATMRTTGVTRCLPTLITSSFERFAACVRPIVRCASPAVVGIHMEGPYVSAEDGVRGAHPRAHVASASIDDFLRRQEAANGRIRLVTLAPEVPGAVRLTEYLVGQGVRVAIGHTSCTRDELQAVVHAGASLSTHLGNGCAQYLHRHDNVIWEQLAADELVASLIVDGHHLPAAVVKAMVRAKGRSRTILVTDAMSAACAPPGRYCLGEMDVAVSPEGRVSPPDGNHLAGSAVSMDVAVALTARICGLGLEEALLMVTVQPAGCIAIEPAGVVQADWDGERHRLTVSTVVGDE